MTRKSEKDRPDESGGVKRRTVLLGAAASAGVVAANAAPALAAPRAPAASALAAAPSAASLATTSAAAVDVTVSDAGEVVRDNVQVTLEALDARLANNRAIDDLGSAMTLVDDFMGNNITSGSIGQLGWSLGNAMGTVAVGTSANQPGVIKIGPGTSNLGWQNLTLGSQNLLGSPAFTCEWRMRLGALNTLNGANTYACWFGLLQINTAGEEPARGFYFRYTPGDGAKWVAVSKASFSSTTRYGGVAPDLLFHRFRITCDANPFAVRFFIDDAEVVGGPITSPAVSGYYSPSIWIANKTGSTPNQLQVDYFALRYAVTR